MTDDDYSLRLVTDGARYRRMLLDLIGAAEREILIETYIFEYDGFGREVLEALAQAHRRGVQLRLLMDGYGSHEIIREHLDVLQRSPATIRLYHPLPWPISRFDKSNFGRVTSFFRLLLLANKRDHRKIIVVDGHTAILGSRNIWDESLEWNEASLFLTGRQVKEVRDSFERVWLRSSNLHKRRNLRQRLRLRAPMRSRHVLTNDPGRKRWQRAFIHNALRSARKRIWITTPYLNPQVPFVRLLKKKAREGVDIRILLPSRSDVMLTKWLTQTIYHEMLRENIRIYEYTGAILHAKALLADEQVIIGSSNFNFRSLRRDLEIDYSSEDRQLVEDVLRWKEDNYSRSMEVTSIEQVSFLWPKKLLRLLLVPLKTSL